MRSVLILVLLLASCAKPPLEAYVTGSGRVRGEQAVDLGTNEVGEPCNQASGAGTSADVYCGSWQQPSARVRVAGPADANALQALATSGPWRTNIDSRYLCPAPRSVSIGGQAALQMDCTGRVGGWPRVALVVLSEGRVWLADGVAPALPAIGQSIAVLSGRTSPKIVSSAAVNAQLAERQGAQAKNSGDGRAFDTMMSQGARANLADDPVAAESAYGAALAIQEKVLGKDNPNVSDPLIHLALQLSNEGRFAEADSSFARAEKLVPLQRGDATLPARLEHYEGLHALNQGKTEMSLQKLREAEAGYLKILPPSALQTRPVAERGSIAANLEDVLATQTDRQNETALLGLIEARRNEAVVLRVLNRPAESDAAIASARDLSRNARLEQPSLMARLRRTAAVSASAAGNDSVAITAFDDSNAAFLRAFPGSRPLALVELLRGQELMRAGRVDAASSVCRDAVRILVEIKSGYEPERMAGCLDALAAAAAAASSVSDRQQVLQDMFLASQLVRSSKTEQQINQSAARLGEGNKDSKVGEAIRQQQDAAAALAAVRRQRETEAQAVRDGAPGASVSKDLEEREQKAAANLADKESSLQAAAPNYGQLVQQATKASDVLSLLAPGEAFAAVTLTADGGWTFLLRDGTVQVFRIQGGAAKIDPLVTRIRAAMIAETPAFDAAASQQLYKLLFGDLGKGLDGVKALTVAPTGNLLSLPFGVLLTGPADPASLATAPWLARKMAIGHLPSAGNFVALRKNAGTSKAGRPWFGFGDFHPVTLAQARRSFGPACGDTAEILARLPPLPSARQELALAARLLGANANEELLGDAFTVPAVRQVDLSGYKVLHFATHAILPTDLKCQTEPAIVTSAPRNAPDASGALLKASDLAQIKLDADLVILSACNSGGPDGKLGGGESLSSLARSFFYGGARALLITHWEVSDQAATFMIADTLRLLRENPGAGTAVALQSAQVDVLDRAGKGLPAEFAHPFYWAPFALIGQASAPPPGKLAAAQ